MKEGLQDAAHGYQLQSDQEELKYGCTLSVWYVDGQLQSDQEELKFAYARYFQREALRFNRTRRN